MKGSAATQETAESQQAESAFQRFAKTMRALIAVPKPELDEKLRETNVKKRAGSKSGPQS
jgi:hypothetical protein